jgi:hypothetical protein
MEWWWRGDMGIRKIIGIMVVYIFLGSIVLMFMKAMELDGNFPAIEIFEMMLLYAVSTAVAAALIGFVYIFLVALTWAKGRRWRDRFDDYYHMF